MPQVWVTYQELGELLDSNEHAARGRAIQCGWRRRECRDGLARVKLPPAMAHEYMMSYALATHGGTGADELTAFPSDGEQAREGKVRRNLRHLVW
jgi:hypothetical protein